MKYALFTVGLILVTSVVVYGYFGGFLTLVPIKKEQGGEVLVYENVIGDYKQTKAVSDKIYFSLLNEEKIETTRGFGIFYDNPKEVDKDKLRSEVGCILDMADADMIARLEQKYKVRTLPVSNAVTVEFPYKGMPSVLVGIMKVYPALEKYSKDNGLADSPMMEIYDIPNKKIIYRKIILNPQ